MKNLETLVILVLIVAFCSIVGLGLGKTRWTLHSTTPVAVAASDVRAVDELIGEQVLIKFTTGAGYGKSHEKVKGGILKRRGQFLVVYTKKGKTVWCNLQNISTIWPEEEK